MGQWRYIRLKKTKPHEPGHWPERKKVEAVTTYLATGSLVQTAKIINVPTETVKAWKKSDWWKEMVGDIQSGEGQVADNKMSKVIDKTLDMLVTRLEDGDFQYDQKTGRLVKVPLKARDLERIASGLFDKRQLIRKQPTNIKEDDLNSAARLLNLAKQFAEFAGQKPKEEKLINEFIEGDFEHMVEDNNAIHDQRQTQLQEGVGLGKASREETTECTGSTQQGTSHGG